MNNQLECLICQRIDLIKKSLNPYFVAELKTGYVVLGDSQYFKGYTLFLSKIHTSEIHLLPSDTKKIFLEEMSFVAEAVYHLFKPKKLNYELLGNTDEHLHWHIFPRYGTDPQPDMPIWVIDKKIQNAPEYVPTSEMLREVTKKLADEINKIQPQRI